MVTAENKDDFRYPTRRALGLVALLVLAALFALVLPRLQREEHTLVFPIEVTGIPGGYVIASQSATRAKIRVIGQPADLTRTDLIHLQVSLPEHPELDGAYPIVPSLSPTLPLEVLEITPTEIHLRLAPTVVRKVPVRVRLEGEPAPGFRLGRVTVTPPDALVSGPMEHIQRLETIETTPISVANASAPLKIEIPAEHTGTPPLTVTPELYTVLVEVEEVQATSRLKGIPVTPDPEEPRRVAISPKTVSIEVSGPARLVEALKAGGGVTAVIETHPLETGIFVRRAAITLPEGVNLIKATPELFTVTIPPQS